MQLFAMVKILSSMQQHEYLIAIGNKNLQITGIKQTQAKKTIGTSN